MIDARITVGQLIDCLKNFVKHHEISEGAAIVWADMCEENDDFQREFGITPGSVVLGIEYLNEGERYCTTLSIAPSRLNAKLN